MVRDAGDVDRLVFSPLCVQNLATYLKGAKREPTAIVAKACDTRALAVKLQENDVLREDLVVIAVGCDGVVDPSGVEQQVPRWQRIEETTREGDVLIVRTDAGEARLSMKADAMLRCATCRTPQPVIDDVRIGEFPTAPPEGSDPYRTRVAELDAMTREERRAFFVDAFSRCIRCYACRNVCPMCSCERCLADETRPQWVPRSTLGDENEMFHLVRAMHLAGRCVECGSCESVCPMDVPLMALSSKMAEEVEAMFGQQAGMDMEYAPPFSRYKDGDPDLPGHGGEV
jgi:ferredoxin